MQKANSNQRNEANRKGTKSKNQVTVGIIYDVNDEQLFNMVLIITGFTAMFCLCAVLGYKEFSKHKRGG